MKCIESLDGEHDFKTHWEKNVPFRICSKCGFCDGWYDFGLRFDGDCKLVR